MTTTNIIETDQNLVKRALTAENILAKVFPALISNGNLEAMERPDVVSDRFLDLNIIYKVDVEVGYIVVNEALLVSVGLLPAKIREAAMRNAGKGVDIFSLGLFGIGGEDAVGSVVVTKELGGYGAGSILDKDVLEMVRKRLGGDYFILPSSVHEVICMPLSETDDLEFLRETVAMINRNEVAPNDRLSDTVYWYRDGAVQIATDD
ncbi:MAG: DUF5688 family protein [Lachnospiraceae bacterium]|nr:DUF5688 family protein [Lachnospiraceae bacterium]